MESTGIEMAVKLAGGSPLALARLIGSGVTRQNVEHWLKKGVVPFEYCAPIEVALERKVMRWSLRPADWHICWIELIGAEGAPPVPAEVRDAA